MRCGAVLDRDVDAVVGRRVVDPVPNRLVLPFAVEPGGDAMVEGERIPSEPATRPKAGGDALEHAASVAPGGQMKK